MSISDKDYFYISARKSGIFEFIADINLYADIFEIKIKKSPRTLFVRRDCRIKLLYILIFYKEVLAVYFRECEVSCNFITYSGVVHYPCTLHLAVLCAVSVDVNVVLPLNLFVTAALKLEEVFLGSVEDIVFDYEVCSINDSSGTDVGCRTLIRSCEAEAVTCKTADVVLVGDVYKISCCALCSSVKVLEGVDTSENYVVGVCYVLHNEVAGGCVRYLMCYTCVIYVYDVAVVNGVTFTAAVNFNRITESCVFAV